MESTTVAGVLIFLMISGAAGLMFLRSLEGLNFIDDLYSNSPNNRPARRGR